MLKDSKERCTPAFMKGKIKTYQQHLSRYNLALMHTRGKKVLDAACGSGYGTNLIYDVADSVVGLDISVEAIEYAKKNYRGDFYLCNFEEENDFSNFDIVVSFETIEHLASPHNFLKSVSSTCNEFLFSIPVDAPNAYHKVVYSVQDILDLISPYYANVSWMSQRGLNIYRGIKKDYKYIIGYAKK